MTTVQELETTSSRHAERVISQLLRRYGLQELSGWALGLLNEGASPERIEIELEDQQPFRQRFRAIFERRQQIARGREIDPISVDEILLYEGQIAELESFYGYPRGTLGDAQDRIIEDTSYNELQALVAAEEDFLSSSPQSQDIFRQFYEIGATKGEVVAASINEGIGVPALQQRIEAANVASESVTAGFGDLSQQEAEDLVARGLNEQGAREAFSLMARSQQLTQNFSRSDLIDLAAGDGPAVERFRRNQRRAVAAFSGGGGFSGGTRGLA